MTDVALGTRELEVMGIVWSLGSATVSEVRDALDATLAYTTVLTILRNLEEKGMLAHVEEGRAHRYVPRVAQTTARRSAVRRLVDSLFHGSAEQLLVHLVQERTLSAEDLARIRRTIVHDENGGPPSRAKRRKRP